MCTSQKYCSADMSANSDEPTVATTMATAEPTPSAATTADQWTDSRSKSWPEQFLDDLLKQGDLTEEQRGRVLLLPVPDNSMTYPLIPPGRMAVVQVIPRFWRSVTGLVALTTHQQPQSVRIGRVNDVDAIGFDLVHDNASYPTQKIRFDDLSFLGHVLTITGVPVL